MDFPVTPYDAPGTDPEQNDILRKFLASPEGQQLLAEGQTIDRVQRGTPPQAAVTPETVPVPRQPNPFASLLGSEDATLKSLLGATATPPRSTRMDPWDLLAHLGPALMVAGSKPGASFLGSLGEGLGAGMKGAMQARRDSAAQAQQDRLYDLQRAKLGVDIAQSMKKTTKPPVVQELFDEKTGQPYKAQFDETTGEWKRIGGVKVDTGKAPTVQEFFDEQGRAYKAQFDPATQQWNRVGGSKADGDKSLKTQLVDVRQVDGTMQPTLVNMATGDPIKTIGAPSPVGDGKTSVVDLALPDGRVQKALIDTRTGATVQTLGAPVAPKPPEGFRYIDPADPSRGAEMIPGVAEGRAAQEALKPFTLPENATRVAPAPAGPAVGSPYAQGVRRLENNTGNPAAKNPVSTATGDGQFIEKTWLGLWPEIAKDAAPILAQKGIDPANLTPQQILSLRADPQLSAVAIDTYAKQNASALRQVTGREPTPGELYLAHFLGAAGAQQLLRADPSTPISQIVTGDAYAKNESLLRGHTAGSLRASFDRRMGRGQGIASAPAPTMPAAPAAPQLVGQQNQPQVGPGYQIVAQGAKVPKVDNAYDQTEGKNLAEQRQVIADDAKTGRQTLPLVDALEGLFTQVGTGKTAPISATMKGWAKSLGIDLPALGITDNVGSAEAARALAREASLKFIGQTKGAVSNTEMEIFQAMVPAISNTPEGNAILLNSMRAVAKRQIEIEKAARQYEGQRGGRLDRGFSDLQGEIFARNPLLPPELIAMASKPATAGAGPAPAPRGLTQQVPAAPSQPVPMTPAGTATAAPSRGAAKSLAPQIKLMDMGTLQQLAPEALSPEDRQAAADRWEELNRGAR